MRASGSLDKVMSGKHFNRALRVHKVTLQTLERLLLEKFELSLQEGEKLTKDASELVLDSSKKPSCETLDSSLRMKPSAPILIVTSNLNRQCETAY